MPSEGRMTMPSVTRSPRRGRPVRLPAEQASNRTVVFGLQLLKTVIDAGKPIALTEVAKQMAISPSRAHRYLASLSQAGFVKQDEDTGRYDVGAGAIELGVAAAARVSGMQVATQAMEDLTATTGLVSYICIWGTNGPTIIRREQGAVQTAVRIREGSRLPMLTATGQIFLAYLPDEQTRDLLTRDLAEWNASAPANSRVSLEQVEKIRRRVRNARIARSTGVRHPTWTALSSPVFRGGKFTMALTLIGVSRAFDTQLDGEVASSLKTTAELISSTTAGW
jgi:DNA-binding IclR family transcriptional regulator